MVLKPSMRTSDLKKEIESGLVKIKEPLQYFNETVGYLIVVPMEKKELCGELLKKQIKIELIKDMDNYVQGFVNLGLSVINFGSDDILSKYKIKPNSTLVFVGDYKLKSDSPPECLTYNYKAGTITNYFSCENCNINCKRILMV